MTSGLYVMKFGGSSVATISRIGHVASIIKSTVGAGHKVAVVVSAMHGVTNQLVELTRKFISTSADRECDVVVSTGEQVSSGLLSLCLKQIGVEAKSFQGWQIPIVTDQSFGDALVSSVVPDTLLSEIGRGVIPVISGFQGISPKSGSITTLGRGGSDATAVAIADAIGADECFIYTDVDGVYTADPRVVLSAKRIDVISFEEMLELTLNGAKVLQAQSVQLARAKNVTLRVLSSFTDDSYGTVVRKAATSDIVGIAHNMSSFAFKALKKPDHCATTIKSFGNQCFTADKSFQSDFLHYEIDNDVGIVSIVGNKCSDVESDVINELASHGIQIKNSILSNMSFSIVVNFQNTISAANVLHNLLFL